MTITSQMMQWYVQKKQMMDIGGMETIFVVIGERKNV